MSEVSRIYLTHLTRCFLVYYIEKVSISTFPVKQSLNLETTFNMNVYSNIVHKYAIFIKVFYFSLHEEKLFPSNRKNFSLEGKI